MTNRKIVVNKYIILTSAYVLLTLSCSKEVTRTTMNEENIENSDSAACDQAEPLEMIFVDLGLPSGTLWGSCNIGATNINRQGERYAWGELFVKGKYEWDNYKYADLSFESWAGEDIAITKYSVDTTEYTNNHVTTCFADGKTRLSPSDDIANVLYGAQIPTEEQVKELSKYCTISYDKDSHRLLLTGRNRNNIQLEDRLCWTSSLCTNYSAKALGFIYDKKHEKMVIGEAWRFFGAYIRPVKTK